MMQHRARTIQVTNPGGPEVMTLVEVDLPNPKPHEVLIEQTAIGINFIDTYHRSGLYPIALPSGIGLEAVGRVLEVGAEVDHFSPGDRIATFLGPIGAYADKRCIPADALIALPDDLDDEAVAASLVKGCTAEFLLLRCFPVQPGDWVLFHAAAGGVGSIAGPWLKALGARSIGTVGSEAKKEQAARSGYDHVLVTDRNFTSLAQSVRNITSGEGVAVVFDGVGASSFQASLDCLTPRGTLVSFGNASGAVTGVDLSLLAQKGSLYVTRPTLLHYYLNTKERDLGLARLFEQMRKSVVAPQVHHRWPLDQAVDAHRALEERQTTGSCLLIP